MTFDFTSDWQDSLATQSGEEAAMVSLRPLSAPAKPKAPPHPSNSQLAELVQELFTEGSLSWDQLQSLSRVAELKPMLEPAIAGIPSVRRVSGLRR